MIKLCTLAAAGFLLSACQSAASGANLPPAVETLLPQITADGSKFFTFSREYTELQPAPDTAAANTRRARAVMRPSAIEPRLEAVLEQTGYCREGYFELYRERQRQRLSVRGECREDATDEDRRQFSGELLHINQ